MFPFSVSICPVISSLSSQYGEKTGSSLVKIAQVARIDLVATWRCLCGRIISNKSILMQDNEEGTVHAQFTVVVHKVQFSELLQKETDAGARGVDHVSRRVLTDIWNDQLRRYAGIAAHFPHQFFQHEQL